VQWASDIWITQSMLLAMELAQELRHERNHPSIKLLLCAATICRVRGLLVISIFVL